MVAPPLLAGAVNATVADVLVDIRAATPIVGAPGTVVGVILLLAELDAPAPTLFVADTVNV
jgi:flagellar motor component MotA